MKRIKAFFNKPIFNFNDISVARGFIYAFAILWIVLFHSSFQITNLGLKWIKIHGDCGVDIFFLLSGISLYFSYTRNRNIKQFYANRLWRILPVYYLLYIGIILSDTLTSGGGSISDFLLKITMLDYFRKGTAGIVPWFLVAILIVYLIYPLLYKIFFDEYKHKEIAIATVFIICYALYIITTSIYYNVMRTFSERFFIILLGIFMGKLVYEKKN